MILQNRLFLNKIDSLLINYKRFYVLNILKVIVFKPKNNITQKKSKWVCLKLRSYNYSSGIQEFSDNPNPLEKIFC